MMLHTLRNMLKLLQPGTIPLLHNAAHGVNGTVAKVSPQHLPHQLKTQKEVQTRENNRGEKITGSGYELCPSHHNFQIKEKKKVCVCMYVCPHLPAGFTKLLDVDSTTECDDEDSERV